MTEIHGPTHQIEPELLGPTPRRVRYSQEALFVWRVAWNLLPAILCLLYYFGSRNIDWLNSLRAHGRSIDAFVTSLDRTSDEGRAAAYVVDYARNKDATTADGSFVFVNVKEANLRVGERFQVTYLDDNPTEYYFGLVGPAQVEDRRNLWLIVSIGAASAYLCGLWALYAFCEARRKLLANGVAVVATVIERHYESNGAGFSYCLRYRFRHPAGKTYSREIRVGHEDYDSFSDGSEFTVLVSTTDVLVSEPYFRLSEFRI